MDLLGLLTGIIGMQAANWGSDDCVRLLLSRSANPNAVDGLWRTPLMLASMHAHRACVVMQTLIDAGNSPVTNIYTAR